VLRAERIETAAISISPCAPIRDLKLEVAVLWRWQIIHVSEQAKLVSVWSSRFVLKVFFGIEVILAGMAECVYGSGIQFASGILSFNPVYQWNYLRVVPFF